LQECHRTDENATRRWPLNDTRRRGLTGLLFRWAGELRFPWLLAFTATLFLIDLLLPDFLPFADEILLGMATLVFAAWRRRRNQTP